MQTPTGRRSFLAGVAGVAAVAGCLDLAGGGDGPQELSYEVTLTEQDGELAATVTPSGDVTDVVRVNVGDEVTFAFANERDGPTGVHDHVTDAEFVVEPGATHEETFTPSSGQVGRHEVEAFPASSGGDHHGTATDHDHDGTATDHDGGTATGDGGGDHGAESTVVAVVEVRPQGS